METFIKDYPWLIFLVIILALWESVWKLIAFWKSARNNQLAWFVCIGIFNTIGILPIVYLLWFQKKQAEQVV
jgi:predicted permease